MRCQALRTVLLAVLLPAAAGAQWGFVTTNAPPGRTEATMTYDLFRARIVLFGGSSTSGAGDTWTYDGVSWTQENPAQSPTPRRRCQMVFDLNRGVAVLYGGAAGNRLASDETWEWDGSNWTLVRTQNSPGGLARYGAAYDVARGRVVVYGGHFDSWIPTAAADTWEYVAGQWTLVPAAGGPGPLEDMAMAYDMRSNRVILFGGTDPAGGANQDTWAYDGVTWTRLNLTGPQPPARVRAGMVYDPGRGVTLLFGGEAATGNTILNDTWEFDGTSWRQVQGIPSGIYPPRSRFSMALNLALGRIVLFGGRTANLGIRHDTWEYGASFRTFGTGCAGSNGVPALSSRTRPRTGQPVRVSVTNLATASPVAILATGVSNSMSVFGPLPANLTGQGLTGCRAYVSTDLIQVLPAAAGTATWTWTVPNNPSLVGSTYYQQAVSIDPGINPAGLTLSNAGASLIGH